MFVVFAILILTVILLATFIECVFVRNSELIHLASFRLQRMRLNELVELRFHYHAVVGFVGVWECRDAKQNSLNFAHSSIGRKTLLRKFERELEGFSIDHFQKLFEDGDIEDELLVWRRQ